MYFFRFIQNNILESPMLNQNVSIEFITPFSRNIINSNNFEVFQTTKDLAVDANSIKMLSAR